MQHKKALTRGGREHIKMSNFVQTFFSQHTIKHLATQKLKIIITMTVTELYNDKI